jgi:hypothetical protein
MIGGPAKTGARRALLEIMAQGGSHLADNAYHALVRMGCRAGAERAAKRRRQ